MMRSSAQFACLALVLATSTSACGTPEAPGEVARGETRAEITGAQEEVRGTLLSYYEAFSTRDWEGFQRHFWPEATLTTIWTPPGEAEDRVVVTTVPEFIAQAPMGPGSREIFEERMDSVSIVVEGNLAQAWAHYSARFGDPGEVLEWTGIDAFSLLRHGGEWRIVSLTYAPGEA